MKDKSVFSNVETVFFERPALENFRLYKIVTEEWLILLCVLKNWDYFCLYLNGNYNLVISLETYLPL